MWNVPFPFHIKVEDQIKGDSYKLSYCMAI